MDGGLESAGGIRERGMKRWGEFLKDGNKQESKEMDRIACNNGGGEE